MSKASIVAVYIGMIAVCFWLISLWPARDNSFEPLLVNHYYEELVAKKGELAAAFDIKTLGNPSAEVLERGKTLYSQQCAFCHGNEGKGDGVAGVAMNPKPRDYHDNEGWINGNSYHGMFKTLKEGAGIGMASYETLPTEDRIAMIEYIRANLMGNHAPEVTDKEREELDKTYSIAGGVMGPTTITVPRALEVIALDEEAKIKRDLKALNILHESSFLPGYLEFSLITDNDKKAIRVLEEDKNWRKGAKELTKLVTNQESGVFKATAVQLSANEWETLYEFLMMLI